MTELRERPWQAWILLASAVVLAAQQVVRWSWFIEDAAICFAFARNFANGDGLVAVPGGERVEAYSDPLWIAILSAFQAAGLDGFAIAKPVSLVLSLATLWVTWRLARRLLPEPMAAAALVAPVALALNPQFGIWCASGLENALFCFLLALAIHRTVVEIDEGGFPWAAVAYLLLAWTRPEALMYAGLGFGAYAWESVRRGRGVGRPALWVVVFAVPFAVSELLRLWYFAWPLPNTFYAKVTNRGVDLFDWGTRGWKQLRDWSERLWQGYFVPIYVMGLIGRAAAPWRRRLAGWVVVGIAVLFLWPGFAPFTSFPFWPAFPDPPAPLVALRIALVLLAGAGLPLLAWGAGPQATERLLCGWSVTGGLFFTLLSDGDWMGAYRFMSLFAPVSSVLFALGAAEIAAWAVDELERAERLGVDRTVAFRGGVLAGAVVLLSWPCYVQNRDHLTTNRDVTPFMVRNRVEYLREVADGIFLDGPISNMDIDQGAFLWFAPDYRQLDFGMLVEVPMARHWFQQRAFIREYVFSEQRPIFVNYGAWWRGHAGFHRYDEWDDLYLNLPGYTFRGGRFTTVFLRRDLLMAPRPSAPGPRRVRFDWNIELDDVAIRTVWAPGRQVYFEAPFAITQPREPNTDVKVIAFLSREGRVAASWSVVLGLGQFPMNEWKVGEQFQGKFRVRLPPDVAPGIYDLGFHLSGPRGFTVPALDVPATAAQDAPVFARGEVRFPGSVEVVSPEAFEVRIAELERSITTHSQSGACAEAEEARGWLRLHTPDAARWRERPADSAFGPLLAACWARRASVSSADEQVAALARAHRWDFRDATLAQVGGPVADRLFREGAAARAAGDWELAYRRFDQILSFQPWQAWARRWAEEARDRRLGLWDDVRVGIGGENDLRAAEEAGTVPPTNL